MKAFEYFQQPIANYQTNNFFAVQIIALVKIQLNLAKLSDRAI